MKKKITNGLRKAGKNHRLLKMPCVMLLSVFLFLYNIGTGITHNYRRITCTALLLCFFVASSSFTFESYGEMATEEQMTEAAEEALEVSGENKSETGDATGLLDESELLDDKDVTEGYENSEFEYVKDNERFNAEDILDENEDLITGEMDAEQEKSSMRSSDWNLVLINKQHSVPEDYDFTLGTITGRMQCDERIIPNVLEMLKAAKEDGVNLVICSPYRDFNRQEVLFNRKITAYMKKGMSYLDAYRITAQAVTVPGASEHQIGLALDIICDSYASLNEGFGETEAGKWLAKHSCEYGFILRYPLGKEYITGIEYEPWHFRYVGVEAATMITEEGITLEEFVDELPD